MILTILIFGIVENLYIEVQGAYRKFHKEKSEIVIEEREAEITKEKDIQAKKYAEEEEKVALEELWQIEIPKIELEAPISEGTSQEVMLEYVGHFENTGILNGNIGLAAHNRGFPINYFARLKELEINDEIIYKTQYGTKKYKVILSTIIQDTDWSYLQETEENKITLITCVENEPAKRRCIQGIEIKEE